MTILTSAYISLTGLLTFSKALDVISDNVANLNTTGFKGSDLFFKSLQSGEEFSGLGPEGNGVPGAGAAVAAGGRRFLQGEVRETGTATHLAIEGAGFFVLRAEDGLVLTRSGQFQFDDSGNLVDAAGRIVQGLIPGGGLVDLRVERFRTNPPTPTSSVTFAGNLSVGGTTHQVTRVVFDSTGAQRTLTFTFTNNTAVTAGSWLVSVAEGATQVGTGEIRFQGSGAPATGFNTVQITLPVTGGTGTAITLNFGAPGMFDGATSFSAGQTSTLAVTASDGFGLGRVTEVTFDEKGTMKVTYSNGQTENLGTVALATVADPQRLDSQDGTLFTAREDQPLQFVAPGDGGGGRLLGSSLELANVELSREFADIIILQRGFQASSQVLNVSSKMIEDVYNNLSGRR